MCHRKLSIYTDFEVIFRSAFGQNRVDKSNIQRETIQSALLSYNLTENWKISEEISEIVERTFGLSVKFRILKRLSDSPASTWLAAGLIWLCN